MMNHRLYMPSGIKTVFLYTLLLFLCSCENEVKLKDAASGPRITLNSIIRCDTAVSVQLYEGRYFLDSIDYIKDIKGASVKMWADNRYVEDLRPAKDGFPYETYVSDYRPRAGDKIRITASAEGYDDTACQTEVKSPVDIISARYKTKFYYQNRGSEDKYVEYKFMITFSDNPDELDYYRLTANLFYTAEKGFPFRAGCTLHFDDPASEAEKDKTGGYFEQYMYKNKYNIFSDKLFNGKTYTLTFTISQTYEEYYKQPQYKQQQFHIDIQHLSKDYYLYLKTMEAARSTQLIPGFSEPVQVYTNVEGGMGILGAYTSSVVVVEIPLNAE